MIRGREGERGGSQLGLGYRPLGTQPNQEPTQPPSGTHQEPSGPTPSAIEKKNLVMVFVDPYRFRERRFRRASGISMSKILPS